MLTTLKFMYLFHAVTPLYIQLPTSHLLAILHAFQYAKIKLMAFSQGLVIEWETKLANKAPTKYGEPPNFLRNKINA